MRLTNLRFRVLLAARAGVLGAVAGLAVFLAAPAGLAAQDGQEVRTIRTADGRDGLDLGRARRGFDLFASGDAAMTGLRANGAMGMFINNYGDCSSAIGRSCQSQRVNLTRAAGTSMSPWFHLEWVAGAPPSEWLKIRAVAPSAARALGRGWTSGFNGDLVGRPVRFGPHDGTLGALFSGSTATADGTCRDNTSFGNGNFFAGGNTGFQLLAGSDCAETWGSNGWEGDEPISLEGWASYKAQAGPNFAFDFWRVPAALKKTGAFLGSNFSTYGETSDFYAEIKAAFGEVIPGGSGTPRLQGYPLGLVIRFESFNFAVPTVASAKFVQALVINRSEDVWGVPIDYDSLYFGLSQGTLQGTQGVSEYAIPEKGMVLFHNSNAVGAGGPCDQSFRRTVGTTGCNGNAAVTRGYFNGGVGLAILKSPIGDLRNKLFTRTAGGAPCTGADPFCDPANPLAGDTITFNQHKMGGFGGADAATWGFSARAGFGFLSGTEENTLDGRAINTLADAAAFQTFRNIGWPGIRGVYNKYVPGEGGGPGSTWDWNKDGIADTINSATCGPFGCVAISSDTLPGTAATPGQVNSFGNIGGVLGVGPIRLAAGDTVSFVYAVVGDGDSAKFWNQMNAVLDLYLNFYLSPEPPPRAEIVSTQIVPGTDQFGTADPTVRLFWSDDPEKWTDPFLAKVASDVAAADPTSDYGRLRELNDGRDITIIQVDTVVTVDTLPGPVFDTTIVYDTTATIVPSADLVSLLQERAADNLEQIEVYKSCDAGNTFTSDGDCDADPATLADGSADGLGWLAYEIFKVDDAAGGNIPNTFLDGNVDGGRTYLYTVVGKSRGATFVLNTPDGTDTVTFAPSVRNVLSRSVNDPNVRSVYVPASRPAGFRAAAVSFSAGLVPASAPFTLTLADDATPGAYRAVFGNRIVVTRDSSRSGGVFTQTTVSIDRLETVNGVAGTPIRTETFTLTNPDVFQVADTLTPDVQGPFVVLDQNGDSTDVARVVTTHTGLGFVLASGTVPIFGSTNLTGGPATPTGLLTQSIYPGFTISADNSLAGSFNQNGEAQIRGATSIQELRLQPSDTVVPRGIVNTFMVQWREASATRPNTVDGAGQYAVSWLSDPFGVQRGFALDTRNPAATEAEVRASLEARPVGTTGRTDISASGLTGVAQEQLVAVKTPFTIRNVTHNRDVQIAMARRLNNRIVLGSGADTASVEVPVDQWVPGDRLFLIEPVTRDSVRANGIVLDGSGNPVQWVDTALTFSQAVLGCDTPRETCNPLVQGNRGATGYNPMNEGDATRWEYYQGFKTTTDLAFTVTGAVTGSAITAVTDSALALIRVVPNPYLIYSQYQSSFTDSRLLFTNLPSTGTLRIYTVAGQFVQQVTWTADDLEGDGDLFWDLKTREGIDIASGLYLWVLTAPTNPNDANSAPIQARGKFVVIRGDSR